MSKKIKRIAVVQLYPLPAILTTLFHCGDKIVGMPVASKNAIQDHFLGALYPALLKAQTDYDQPNDVDLEKLKQLQPDLVLFNGDDPIMKQKLRTAGFNAVGIYTLKYEFDALATLKGWVAAISEILPGDQKRIDFVTEYSQTVYDCVHGKTAAITNAEQRKIFFLYRYLQGELQTSGAHFYGQYWAEAIGAQNVAQSLKNQLSATVSFAQIQKWAPAQILITNFTSAQPEDLMVAKASSDPWHTLQAVEQKQVFKMPLGLYRSFAPGVENPLTLMWLAKTVYPEIFAKVDLVQKTKNYYQKLLDVTLTEAQVAKIFAPSATTSAY